MSEADQGVDFEAFVLETSAAFDAVARAEAGDLHSAQDAVQVVYERMFRSWERLSTNQGSLVAYGRTALKNAVKDQFRSNKKLLSVPPQELPDRESSIGIPEAAYEMIKEGIDDLVAKLPEAQRQVITLCVLQDMSPGQAGRLLGRKEETVKRYIRAAIKNLQKYTNELSEEETA
ncbi:sigma-70 family RNA polymerase sigma factor [Streptomyces olivaceiscleroticus]|uniref:RNA polymerase subunit sigma-24 n=1 Tax=Streptomyces olivaceiscleroticus TaxID=68245 RepID=A0ABP3JIH8_9ACTN